MRMMRKMLIAGAAGLAVAACGKIGDLQPRAGQTMPAKAYGQSEASTAEQLSTPSVQARPGRSDELMRRSERRREDPFDLPPGKEPEKAGSSPAAPAKANKKKPS